MRTGADRGGIYRGHVMYVCEGEASKSVMAEWHLCLRCCLLGALDSDGVLPEARRQFNKSYTLT